MEKVNVSSYVLEDGRTWNAVHLSLIPEAAMDIMTGPAAGHNWVRAFTKLKWQNSKTCWGQEEACLA